MFQRFEHPATSPVLIYFDGNPINCYPGETVSAALLATGIRVFSDSARSKKRKSERQTVTPYCQMGSCFGCLVTINGHQVQACMTTVVEGMQVESVPIELAGDDPGNGSQLSESD